MQVKIIQTENLTQTGMIKSKLETENTAAMTMNKIHSFTKQMQRQRPTNENWNTD